MDKKKILIADSNRHIRQFLCRELMAEGFTVVQAGIHTEIFNQLDQEPCPDLLILDPDIPNIGGAAVMLQLLGRLPRVPVVVYSTYPENGEHPVLGQADAFVEKIANPAFLIKSIRNVLGYGEPTDRSAVPAVE